MKTKNVKKDLAHAFNAVRSTGSRQCNICQQLFHPEFRFQLFCRKCRIKDDSFMFHEWLPRVPEGVRLARLSA